jgi:hypothetical protein
MMYTFLVSAQSSTTPTTTTTGGGDGSFISPFNDRNRLAGGKEISRVRGSSYGMERSNVAANLSFGGTSSRNDTFPSRNTIFGSDSVVRQPANWDSLPTNRCDKSRKEQENGVDDAKKGATGCVVNVETKVDDHVGMDSAKKDKNDKNDKGDDIDAPSLAPTAGKEGAWPNLVAQSASNETLVAPEMPTSIPITDSSTHFANMDVTSQAICNVVEDQEGPTPEWSTNPSGTYLVSTSVLYRNVLITAQDIETSLATMNVPMALWMTECPKIAMGYLFDELSNNTRRLQDTDETNKKNQDRSIVYAQWDSWKAKGMDAFFSCGMELSYGSKLLYSLFLYCYRSMFVCGTSIDM